MSQQIKSEFQQELEKLIENAKTEAEHWYKKYEESKVRYDKENAFRWSAKRRHFVIVLDLYEKTKGGN